MTFVLFKGRMHMKKSLYIYNCGEFFEPFAGYQYHLYNLIFPNDIEHKSERLVQSFEKCRKNNINAIWASESLYVQGNSKEQFYNILEHNLHPVYDSAKLQGYDIWLLK